jgi:hypothetical protein
MHTMESRQDLQRYLVQSKSAIPGILIFGLVNLTAFFLLRLLFPVPRWVFYLIVGVVLFTLVGDLINIVVIKRRLRKADSDHVG